MNAFADVLIRENLVLDLVRVVHEEEANCRSVGSEHGLVHTNFSRKVQRNLFIDGTNY